MSSEKRLIWVDMEMTGLDPKHDKIIEIAIIITDYQLTEVAEGPTLAVYQPDSVLASMDDWNSHTHGSSGLVERVRLSRYNEEAAASTCCEFLKQWVSPGVSPMCGNSICQDRRFMANHMPSLEQFFHYRNLDVSTIKLLAMYWHEELAPFVKNEAHEARADIRESIEELKYYRAHLFAL